MYKGELEMQKKLTISIDEMVYLGFREVIGRSRKSKFIF